MDVAELCRYLRRGECIYGKKELESSRKLDEKNAFSFGNRGVHSRNGGSSFPGSKPAGRYGCRASDI